MGIFQLCLFTKKGVSCSRRPFLGTPRGAQGTGQKNADRLDELAVTEGQELDLKVTATVAVFTQQLVDLLKARKKGLEEGVTPVI